MRAPHTFEIAAFHGTKHRFETFEASPRGHFGSGIYMADRKAAEEYAGPDGIVMSLSVTLARPYHYAATFDHDLDFDSAAVDLVRQVLPDQADALISASMHSDGLLDDSIQIALQVLGFDGLIVTYEDGSQEIIAYSPHQIEVLHSTGEPHSSPHIEASGAMSR
ncbi:hypothetical protein U2H31_003713 [Pseudomonas aeruginosa]|nr:hypothetical protein [Pseudomonas aeruginosa]